MATIARIQVAWSGFVGAPGVSTFYCLDAATFRPGLVAFIYAATNDLPTTVTTTVPSTGDLIDEVTGDITGAWSDGTDAVTTGLTTGTYPAPSGLVVNWLTDTVIAGRRVRGKTFFVPLGGSRYDTNGSIDGATVSAFQSRATTLLAASPGQMLLWHRPTLAGSPSGVTPGEGVPVTGFRVPDLAAVLRSRRD